MELKESLEAYCDHLDNHIRSKKTVFGNFLDSGAQTLLDRKGKVNASLNDSTDVGTLNSLGVLQRCGQIVESYSMELVTLVETLKELRKILKECE